MLKLFRLLVATMIAFGSISAVVADQSGAAEYEIREWTSDQGTTLEASYVDSKADQVTLKRADGSTIEVQVGQLSQTDRQYVARLRLMEHPSLIIAHTSRLQTRSFLELANHVPLRVEILSGRDCGFETAGSGLKTVLQPWEGKKANRYIILEAPYGYFATRKRRSELNSQTKKLLNEANKVGITPLVLDNTLFSGVRRMNIRDGDKIEEVTLTPEMCFEGQKAWFEVVKARTVIPYRKVIDELRKSDARWLAVLDSGRHPEYLFNAVTLATMTNLSPPLEEARSIAFGKLENYQQKVNFANLATLPADETEALSKLIIQEVRAANPHLE